jgi:hypothetical protein
MSLNIRWEELSYKKRKSNIDSPRISRCLTKTYRYLTVDYERGNFSVSQCLWVDGAPQEIGTILSPSYSTNSSSASLPSNSPSSKSKQVSGGIIAGATVAGVLGLAFAGGLLYYCLRRRNRPVSAAPTDDDIALTNIDPRESKDKDGSVNQHQFSPHLADKKLYDSSSIQHSMNYYQPTGELGTSGEIYQLPSHDNREDSHLFAANHIHAERIAANTPEIDSRSIVHELHGSEPTAAELDDEWSRQGTPMVGSRSLTRVSSISTLPIPPSPYI